MCSKNTVIAISTIKCLDKAVLQNITGGGGGGGRGGGGGVGGVTDMD